MNYRIDLDLTKLNSVIETEEEIGDRMEKGIFIPYRCNTIYRRKKGIWLTMLAVEKRENSFGQSHYIKQTCSKERYMELKREAETNSPLVIIGNMKIDGRYDAWKKEKLYTKNNINEILGD